MADTDDRHRDDVPTPTGEDETRTTPPGRGGADEPSAVEGGSAGVRSPGGAPEGAGPEEFDHDVNIRAVVWSGVILAAITAIAFVLMWWLFHGMVASHEGRDPAPPPIREAVEPTVPAGPVLQTEPEEDLRRMLAMEEALLTSYSLVEGEEGYARVPVEVALEMALEQGLGEGAEGVPGSGPDGGPSASGSSAEAGGMSAGEEAVEQPDAAGAAEQEAAEQEEVDGGAGSSPERPGTEGTPAEPTEEQSS